MIGSTISHYRIVARIGIGGMGEVYRAEDPRLGRAVAIKVLPASLSEDRDRLARFEREARAAGSLNHPNVLAIYDVGSSDGVPYIVSELLEGETLRDSIDRGALTRRKAVEYAVQIAEGLAAAHAKGIVHRDLKPSNVFLTRDGNIKLLDFGLAKLSRPDPDLTAVGEAPTADMLTSDGTVVGTAAYMSPEQLQGLEVDHRSDMFSFGVMLFEMLAGRRPFGGDSRAEMVASILRDDPVELSEIGVAAPPALERIIRQCLEKRPEDRFESAHDLAITLRALSESGVSASVGMARVAPRRGARVAAMAVLAVAAAAVIAWWLVARPASRELPPTRHLAVIPFEAVGGEEEHALLAAGLAATVADAMRLLEQQTGGAVWMASEEVSASLERAWRQDAVNLGITGRLTVAADRFRLEVRLVAADGGRQLRRATISDQLGNLSSLQREPVVRIADMLDLVVAPETARALDALETIVQSSCMLCLRGRGLLARAAAAGDLEAALASLDEAVADDPGYGSARIGLARASLRRYLATRDPQWLERAGEQSGRLVGLGGLELVGELERGRIELGAGRPEEAIEAFRAATRIADWNADAYLGLGAAAESAGRVDEAEAAYQAAISRRPQQRAGYEALAFLYWTTNQYDAAVNQFRRVTEVAPDSPDGFNNYGGVLATLGRRTEALAAFERSLAVEPNGVAYSQLGTLHFLEARFGSAAEMFERAVAMAPDDFELLGNLAAAYQWGGQRERSVEVYRRAIAAGEARLGEGAGDSIVPVRLAGCHAMVGERERALELLDEVIAGGPTQARVLGMIAEVYEDLGDRQRALDWIGRALAQGLMVDWVVERPALSKLAEDPAFRRLAAEHDRGRKEG